MSVLLRRQAFSPSCPEGGTWYACGFGSKFVGCCRSEPCNNRGCSDGNLEPASFDPAYYGTFPDQSCPSGSLWYTCTGTDPPFMGCCKINPCSGGNGCPSSELTPGFLSTNPALAEPFEPSDAQEPAEDETQTSDQAGTLGSSGVADPDSGPNTAAIAGGSAGGGAAILVLIGLLLFLWRRKVQKSKKQQPKDNANMSPEVINQVESPEMAQQDTSKHMSYLSDPNSTSAPSFSSPSMSLAYSPSLGYHPTEQSTVSGYGGLPSHSRQISYELQAPLGLGLTSAAGNWSGEPVEMSGDEEQPRPGSQPPSNSK